MNQSGLLMIIHSHAVQTCTVGESQRKLVKQNKFASKALKNELKVEKRIYVIILELVEI